MMYYSTGTLATQTTNLKTYGFSVRCFKNTDTVEQPGTFRPFTTTWAVTGTNPSLSIPLITAHAYDFQVDWGDGTTGKYTSSTLTSIAHTYTGTFANDNTRTVRI
jgi:hypothetical protein